MNRRARVSLRLRVALVVLGVVIALAALAPVLATHDPRRAVPEDQLQAPSPRHYFGTDLLGRDVFSRVLYGARRTLGTALLAAGTAVGPGLLIGLAAGYAGRWIDAGLVLLVDALLAVPGLLWALALLALLGRGTAQIALAVGIAGIAPYARVTRAAVLQARTLPFVEAGRALGGRPAGIVWRHVIPAARATLLAFGGVTLSWAILNAAALAFLGYAGDIAAPDWGVMLADGRQAFRAAPWVAFAPGVMLSLTVFAVNLLASGLRREAG